MLHPDPSNSMQGLTSCAADWSKISSDDELNTIFRQGETHSHIPTGNSQALSTQDHSIQSSATFGKAKGKPLTQNLSVALTFSLSELVLPLDRLSPTCLSTSIRSIMYFGCHSNVCSLSDSSPLRPETRSAQSDLVSSESNSAWHSRQGRTFHGLGSHRLGTAQPRTDSHP